MFYRHFVQDLRSIYQSFSILLKLVSYDGYIHSWIHKSNKTYSGMKEKNEHMAAKNKAEICRRVRLALECHSLYSVS